MIAALMELAANNFLYFILFIKNSDSFPLPLTREEERKYVAECRAGSREAKDILIAHNLRLVAHLVNKSFSGFSGQEELISAGTYGLMKAVETFDGSKGTKLSSYASVCIQNEILMLLRKRKKESSEIPFSVFVEPDTEKGPEFGESKPADNPEELVAEKIESEKLYEYIEAIKNPRDQQILILRYGLYGIEPLAQQEIADMLNISRSYVSRIEGRVLKNLQVQMKRDKFYQ